MGNMSKPLMLCAYNVLATLRALDYWPDGQHKGQIKGSTKYTALKALYQYQLPLIRHNSLRAIAPNSLDIGFRQDLAWCPLLNQTPLFQ